jgi:hypothetical protein
MPMFSDVTWIVYTLVYSYEDKPSIFPENQAGVNTPNGVYSSYVVPGTVFINGEGTMDDALLVPNGGRNTKDGRSEPEPGEGQHHCPRLWPGRTVFGSPFCGKLELLS